MLEFAGEICAFFDSAYEKTESWAFHAKRIHWHQDKVVK